MASLAEERKKTTDVGRQGTGQVRGIRLTVDFSDGAIRLKDTMLKRIAIDHSWPAVNMVDAHSRAPLLAMKTESQDIR